jgi:predicted CoA-binding protein
MNDDGIRRILRNTRRIALVGASNKPQRPSYHVMEYLLAQGYDVTPVNPGLAGQEILGRSAVATLAEAAPLDMVELFRAPAEVEAPVAEAIALGAKTIWMHRCPAIDIPALGLER